MLRMRNVTSNTNFMENKFVLTDTEQLSIAKDFIVFNKEMLNREFDTSKEDYDKVIAFFERKITKEHGFMYGYFLAIKSIQYMKEKWAKSIDEVYELLENLSVDMIWKNIEEVNIKSEQVHELWVEQKLIDLELANELAEKIKKDEI